MGRIGRIARRSFLIGSVAVAGGVAFGTWRYRTPYANPLHEGLPTGAAALTPYVLIESGNITLITPRADKGQGAYSAQAALIAEELDVTLDQIRVDPGPPSRAYWNTALSEMVADFTAPGDGLLNSAAHGTLDAMMKFAGMQITGGSTTVADSFTKLRVAGASARETLKAAAAERHGVPRDRLSTDEGAVVLPDGTRIPYIELAAHAARLEPVQDVPLRAPSEWRLIGKPMQRIDITAKSTGTLTYGIDRKVPGMAHATVLLNPAQGGARHGFDASAAKAMRGVKAVLPVTGGVAVVADNTWRAIQAARRVQAEWGEAAFPPTMEAHWQTLSDAFTEDRIDSRKRDDGNVADSLQNNGIIEAEYRAPYLAHAPLEPISAIVQVNDGRAEVWTGTQIPRFVQGNVADIAGIPFEAVTVHAEYIGGSFGHRLEDDVVRRATEVAVQLQGTPIKLTYSREEDMSHEFTRQIAMARLRGSVRDGHVDTLDLGIAMPSVVASQMGRQDQPVPGPDSEIVAGAWDQPFAVPNQRVTGYRAPELAPISSWRSVGASTNGFFYNAALDELIHAAGADPMEERLRLCDDPLARKVLEAVAGMSAWDGTAPGNGRGRGVALTYSFGVPCAEVIEVTGTDDGISIDKVWVAAEVGLIVDPINFRNLVQGGVIFGLGHAMNCEITYTDGVADQNNFHAYEGMRLRQCPEISVRGLENGDKIRGIGEPPVPPAAPALAAAIFAVTGTRLRAMPFSRQVAFA